MNVTLIGPMTPARSRRLALGLLLLAGLLFYLVFVLPVVERHRAYDDAVADLNHRLEHYQRIVRNGAESQRALEEFRRRKPSADYYLKAATAALAAAELQQHVEKAVRAGGARLISTQVVSSEDGAPFPRVPIKTHLQGDMESLRNVIYTLETGKPVLFLDNVFITASPTRTTPASQYGNAAVLLDVHLEVSGYRQGGDE